MLSGLPLFTAVLIAVARAGPCDIYEEAGTPCVAAHSTVRALLDDYKQGLYQVKRESDQKTLDILPKTSGGIADVSLHDEFCDDTVCHISIIYDQSGKSNHLTAAPAGGAKKIADHPAVANRLPVKINKHKAYGVWVEEGIGYRNDNTDGIAIKDEAQAIYMIVDGTRSNDGCCFDYGNAETSNNDEGAGTMEAIYFGKNKYWGHGKGTGPWIMADLEDGLFGCATKYCPYLPTVEYPFLVAMLKGRSGGTFALKQGNAQSGHLKTIYDGPRPPKYTIMKKQGAIVLGIGGDNSNGAIGNFFEGCIVKGNPNAAIDNKIQENIVSAHYGQ
ncbi:hypothetical protein KXD40_008918 [Peronospora effusa]|uniref:Alpha-L-arabinofuranosidase B catalytic domain-containing protein n=1 Tax=Peronospora effusa TaxID=542832 RepID=A0A3M6VA66_9STRA|nr:hypothetical protein DD238_008137 [Peronospora effusa]RQM11087.1 hypothetical protein DD237_007977 [Peronospora effusa]UIZ21887.1 hypothetical protein KXD40_008918 [Peronospora effusa]CAI5703760.1 unnamed protein product [Peronospora effusa]